MKKASLMAIIFACFTFAFTMPAAYAAGTTTGNAMRDNDTLADDVNRGLNRMERGIDRTAERISEGVDRTTDVILPNGNGNNNRARTYGVGDYNGYRTNMNRTDTNRPNTLRTTGYRATATTTAATDNDGIDWGWLGLLGLIGLAGMRNRDRDRA